MRRGRPQVSSLGRLRPGRADGGYTLMEMIVAGSVFMVLGALLVTTLLAASSSSRSTRTRHDLNEEARNSLNRMARELRQADAITYVINADGPAFSSAALTAVSLRADFNRDGCSGNSCPGTDALNNPEDVTYCFNPTAAVAGERESLWLIPAALTAVPSTCNTSGARPILAGRVGGFRVEYRSNDYLYDSSPTDGVTTWRELDAGGPPVGDTGAPDGNINTNAVNHVNALVIHLSMAGGGIVQNYQTQVDLRNKP